MIVITMQLILTPNFISVPDCSQLQTYTGNLQKYVSTWVSQRCLTHLFQPVLILTWPSAIVQSRAWKVSADFFPSLCSTHRSMVVHLQWRLMLLRQPVLICHFLLLPWLQSPSSPCSWRTAVVLSGLSPEWPVEKNNWRALSLCSQPLRYNADDHAWNVSLTLFLFISASSLSFPYDNKIPWFIYSKASVSCLSGSLIYSLHTYLPDTIPRLAKVHESFP